MKFLAACWKAFVMMSHSFRDCIIRIDSKYILSLIIPLFLVYLSVAQRPKAFRETGFLTNITRGNREPSLPRPFQGLPPRYPTAEQYINPLEPPQTTHLVGSTLKRYHVMVAQSFAVNALWMYAHGDAGAAPAAADVSLFSPTALSLLHSHHG